MLQSEPTLPIEAVLPTLPKLLVGQPQRSGLLQDAVFEFGLPVGKTQNLLSAPSMLCLYTLRSCNNSHMPSMS